MLHGTGIISYMTTMNFVAIHVGKYTFCPLGADGLTVQYLHI